MAKHLFRYNFTEPRDHNERKFVKEFQSFSVSDEVIKNYFPLHVLDFPMKRVSGSKMCSYGRDCITEWGNTLFINPEMDRRKYPYIFPGEFIRKLRKAGYKKRIMTGEVLSEGGCFVFGNEFIFVSKSLETDSNKKELQRLLKRNRIDAEPVFLPIISSYDNGHIDCDYHILDAAKIIYVSRNIYGAMKNKNDRDHAALSALEKIASWHGFEIRIGKSATELEDDDLLPDERARLAELEKNHDANEGDDAASSAYFGFLEDLHVKYVPNYKKPAQKTPYTEEDETFDIRQTIKFEKTVNMISDEKRVFTVGMNTKEKKYLESKGLEVIIVPLGDVSFGAGLRCVYGEFNI